MANIAVLTLRSKGHAVPFYFFFLTSMHHLECSLLLQRYPMVWQGMLALKNDQSYVQMHFVSRSKDLPDQALPQVVFSGQALPLRISQRMRLEPPNLEGVTKRMIVSVGESLGAVDHHLSVPFFLPPPILRLPPVTSSFLFATTQVFFFLLCWVWLLQSEWKSKDSSLPANMKWGERRIEIVCNALISGRKWGRRGVGG